jgi:hypothetical protein
VQTFYQSLKEFGPAEWVALAAVIVALIGAWVAIFAARIEVQDNVDRFIADLTRQAKWIGIAAAINIVAGALVFMSAALNVLDK